jgi:threonine aldolase
LSGAMMQTVVPTNGLYLTSQDIQQNTVLTDNVHKCPTRIVALENTISGIVGPLDEMQRISTWCRVKDIKLHLDGARLFEAVASGAASLGDYCTLFDTVASESSKDLGAPMGAMLLGSEALINQARRIRKKHQRWTETSRSLDCSGTSRRGRAVWRRRMGYKERETESGTHTCKESRNDVGTQRRQIAEAGGNKPGLDRPESTRSGRRGVESVGVCC